MRRRYLRYKMRRNIGKAAGPGELLWFAGALALMAGLAGLIAFQIVDSALHLTGINSTETTCRIDTPTRVYYETCDDFNYLMHLGTAALLAGVGVWIWRVTRET